jgi:signal transduction histidine kinase
MMQKFPLRTLLWVSLFAVAFAMIETAVVIYLRELFYPGGFDFPLQLISPGLAMVESIREIATMLLLVSIAAVAARKFMTGIAWFIYAFAIWDIFYYVFLYVFLGWPETLLTWDVLFLLHFTWVGPVIAPVINSLCMILLAVIILTYREHLKIKAWHWAGLFVGAIIIIIAYTEDYVIFMLSDFSIFEMLNVSNTDSVIAKAGNYVPQTFAWGLFFIGVVIHLIVIADVFRVGKQLTLTKN